jgi:hypothetical protein
MCPSDDHGAIGRHAICHTLSPTERAQILHASLSRPPEGTPLTAEIICTPNHHRAIGSDAKRLANTTERAQVLHATVCPPKGAILTDGIP